MASTSPSVVVAEGGVSIYNSIISIASERDRPGADPNRPSFLSGMAFNPANSNQWYNVVLAHIVEMTVIIASTADLHYMGEILGSRELPDIHKAIIKMKFPNFYWFSGVVHNRRHNPYFQLASQLPNLQEVSFTMHTAGITTSRFGEREMVDIEATDPFRAKERKVLETLVIVGKYEINGLFACRSLTKVVILYVECEMTAFFTKVGDPMEGLRNVQTYLIEGFTRHGMDVSVNLSRVE